MFIEQELIRLAPRKGTFLTVGTFDGVHLGHRHLIKELNKHAKDDNLLSGVITFDPPPQSILFPQRECLYIDRAKDRINLLETSGAAMVFVLPFSPAVARLSAEEFVELLSKHLKMRGLLAGPNFALGREREGNLNLLRALGEKLGFRVKASSPFFLDGQLVSSSAIRQALSTGDVALARKLMGRHFSIQAQVISSNKRGRVIGFPTANLDTSTGQMLPGRGVYATFAYQDGEKFSSVTNIGFRPTFKENVETVETHLMDYKGKLYDKELRIEFVERIRNEQQFASMESLALQIEQDIRKARTLLADKTGCKT